MTPYLIPIPLLYIAVASAQIPGTIRVFAAAPGLFTVDGTGTGQAAAINQDGTINSASNPAWQRYFALRDRRKPDFAGRGGWQVSTSPLARQSLPVQVYVGQQMVLSTAQLQYAGPVPGEIAGLMQINVPLPLGLKPGSAGPVVIFVGTVNSSSQSNVTIAVR
jgi:uncharacterized protein (TIGR03437 family)